LEKQKMTFRFETISTNGIYLNTALAGPEDGQPVITLHGFPEAWFGWEHQIQDLAEAGFRVIAPDQRGYNLSDKPEGIDSYQVENLVNDILGLADGLGLEHFHLAGHDWGAMVAWNLALKSPDRVKRLVIANVPHPAVFSDYLRTHPAQMLKSWYAGFFQLPHLPELFSRAGNWRFLIRAMPEHFSPDQQDRYRKAWSQPGAIRGMINWYRAAFQLSKTNQSDQIIKAPTLIIWGKQDPHLSHQMAPLSLEYCQQGDLVMLENATHWVQHDQPELVNKLMIDHFSSKENHGP
jgi:pimeloyl-ACP methyl ester carboxylesterase